MAGCVGDEVGLQGVGQVGAVCVVVTRVQQGVALPEA